MPPGPPLRDRDDRFGVLAGLAIAGFGLVVLGLLRRKVQEANRTGQTAILRRAAPYAVMAAVEESRSELPGLDVQVAPIRRYPQGPLAAQLLGYAGEINERELADRVDKGYKLGDLI